MKLMTIFLLALVLVSCQNSGHKKEITTTVIPVETFDKVRSDSNNESLSQKDIVWARLQNVPIPALGTSRENVNKLISKYHLSLKNSEIGRVVVLGAKKNKSGRNTMLFENPYLFEYIFKDGGLVSGPNIVGE